MFQSNASRYPLTNLLIYSIISTYLTVESSFFDISPYLVTLFPKLLRHIRTHKHVYIEYINCAVLNMLVVVPVPVPMLMPMPVLCIGGAWPTWTINHCFWRSLYARSRNNFVRDAIDWKYQFCFVSVADRPALASHTQKISDTSE